MAGRYDFTIDRNSHVPFSAVWKDASGAVMNLSSYTAKFSMRTTPSSTTETYVRSTAASTITITALSGKVEFTIPASDTMAFTAGRYVYDLLLTNASGVQTRLLEGVITISPEVTR